MNSVNFLIKPASSLCNLRCRYCFYEDIAQNRSESFLGIMQEETAWMLIREAYELVAPRGSVNFTFQGGEPTLAGLAFFKSFVAEAEQTRPKQVRLTFGIQTNGLVIDEEWAEFFREHDFLVGLSMDGYRELHDHYRVDPEGKGSWSRVRGTLQLLQKYHVRVNVLCVVTKQCAQKPETVYKELKKLGIRFIQFISCMDPMGQPRGTMPYSLTPEKYGKFLCRLFDLWYQDWERGCYHSIRLFDDYINLLLGDQFGTCSTCGRCGSYFVVEGDGSVYPCDFFVLDQWKLGRLGDNTLREMAESETAQNFLRWGGRKPQKCYSCPWRPLCNGGCKNDWKMTDGMPENYFCEAFWQLFTHAQQRLMHIARTEMAARRQMRYEEESIWH